MLITKFTDRLSYKRNKIIFSIFFLRKINNFHLNFCFKNPKKCFLQWERGDFSFISFIFRSIHIFFTRWIIIRVCCIQLLMTVLINRGKSYEIGKWISFLLFLFYNLYASFCVFNFIVLIPVFAISFHVVLWISRVTLLAPSHSFSLEILHTSSFLN